MKYKGGLGNALNLDLRNTEVIHNLQSSQFTVEFRLVSVHEGLNVVLKPPVMNKILVEKY